MHVDIEGGWGGSSRSLYELLSRIDRTRISPVVAYRQVGPAARWYADIGVPAFHVPEIGSFVPRRRKALKNLLASMPRLARLGRAAARISTIAKAHGVQLIHLNYEGLFLLARRLRRLGLPMVAHSRAMVPDNRWGCWLVRSLAANVEHMFFISPQEQARFELLRRPPGPACTLLWNISRPVRPRRPFDDSPEAVSFGSLDWAKGTDRLIDIAAALEQMRAPPLRIAIYGLARTNSAFPQAMAARIVSEGLSGRVALRGFTEDPMSIMAGALALIRPSRDNDPWGRDVIEATSAGLPVLATGSYQGVVQDGQTGFLFPSFDAEAMARKLTMLRTDATTWLRLSEAARRSGEQRFSGSEQAQRFADVIAQVANAAGMPEMGTVK